MKKFKVAIIGSGQRANIYGQYMLDHPDEFEVVAVADPNKLRLAWSKERYGLSDDQVFEDYKPLFAREKLADLAVIGTQDRLHYEPSLLAIEKGYDLLLEKPIAQTPQECIGIAQAARQKGVKVLVCHVLRYTDFFGTIKQIIDSGEIGDIVSILHSENVGDIHYSHSYVRGNWRNTGECAPMILTKSCHDMDILQWLAGSKCTKVQSFGSAMYFNQAHRPEGAPDRCYKGCPVKDCPYDATYLYNYERDDDWFSFVATGLPNPTREDCDHAMCHSQYGRCVFACDNDVVDHQVVNLEFENGVTACFSMCAFTPDITRTIKIMGTKGQIRGAMEKEEKIEVSSFITKKTRQIDPKQSKGHVGHGGGDVGIMRALYESLCGTYNGCAVADIVTSAENHMIAFAAERSRLEDRVVQPDEFYKE